MQGTMLGVDDDRDGDVKTHVCVNSMWRGCLKINDDGTTNCGLSNGHKEEEGDGDDDGDDNH